MDLVVKLAIRYIKCHAEALTKMEHNAKMWNTKGKPSRSIGERFGEHTGLILSKNENARKKSVFYEHILSKHNVNPQLGLEVIARCPGDATLRQATEAVAIRDDKPVLNGKDEWTNQPRKRKDNNNKKKGGGEM